LRDVDAFLTRKGEERGWLEAWMVKSRFIPSVTASPVAS
jgi:hypothetical protein